MGLFDANHFGTRHFGAEFFGDEGEPLTPDYEFPWWQQRLFLVFGATGYRVDLWQPTQTPTATTWTHQWANVKCYLIRNPSASQLEMFGRTEQDDLFTRDIWFFHRRQPIDDTWCIILKAYDARDEQPSEEYGKAWICEGDARRQMSMIGDEGHVEIVSVAQTELPAGVSV